MKPTKQGGEILAIYKVVRNLKFKHLGWIMSGRFVWCRAIFAKNYVIRRELVRCFSKGTAKQDAVKVNAIWIDTEPEPGKKKTNGKINKTKGQKQIQTSKNKARKL